MKTFALNMFGVACAALILLNGYRPIDLESGYIPSEITFSQPTQFELWAEAIAEFESRGDPTVVNRFGMMGKYQFSPSTVAYLGFSESPEEFLSSPQLQDSVFVVYSMRNRRELDSVIDKFNGSTKYGFRLTTAGILAGAHFAGAGGVRRFLNGEGDTVDSNGTSVKYYMQKFSDYNLEETE